MPIWRIVSCCVSSQSMWSSSDTRMSASSSRVPLSPLATHTRDAVVEALDGGVLELEVELQLLGDGLADAHREQALHVRHAVEVEDPVDDDVGVLHLVDRLVAAVLREAVVAPVRRTSWSG